MPGLEFRFVGQDRLPTRLSEFDVERYFALTESDIAALNERFRRVWRVYLHGCAEMFRSPIGVTHLFQIVFAKGNITRERYPMSRAFLYEEEAQSAMPAETPRRRAAGRVE